MGTIYCSNCGQANFSIGKFCIKCGEKLTKISNSDSTTSESIFNYDVSENAHVDNESNSIKSKPPKMSKEEEKSARNGCLIIIAIIIVIAYFVSNNTNDNNQKDLIPVLTDTDLIFSIEYYLKSNYLKDPDSYQYIESSKTVFEGDVPNKYVIHFKYRAKNSFGGYVIEEKIFTLDQKGDVVDMQNLN